MRLSGTPLAVRRRHLRDSVARDVLAQVVKEKAMRVLLTAALLVLMLLVVVEVSLASGDGVCDGTGDRDCRCDCDDPCDLDGDGVCDNCDGRLPFGEDGSGQQKGR